MHEENAAAGQRVLKDAFANILFATVLAAEPKHMCVCVRTYVERAAWNVLREAQGCVCVVYNCMDGMEDK